MNSLLDGAHTLTCALMLLNTDLHGHVSRGLTKGSLEDTPPHETSTPESLRAPSKLTGLCALP